MTAKSSRISTRVSNSTVDKRVDELHKEDQEKYWRVAKTHDGATSYKLSNEDGSTAGHYSLYNRSDHVEFGTLVAEPGQRGVAKSALDDLDRRVPDKVQKLDAFDGDLPAIYSKYGFKETDRIKWDDRYAPTSWKPEYGRPDVVFMERPSAIDRGITPEPRNVDTLDAESIKDWFKSTDSTSLPISRQMDFDYAHQNPEAWLLISDTELGMPIMDALQFMLIDFELRHLPGKHNQKEHGRKGDSSTVKGTDQTEWAAGLSRDGYAENDIMTSTDFNDPRDRTLIGIAKQQGFDGKPTKGSIEDTVRNGGVEIHRGVVPHKGTGKSGDDLVNDFKDGPYEPGTGIYGNGFYFSNNARVADHYAKGSPARKNSKPTPGGKSFKAALKPDAKVIGDEDLKTEMKAWQKQAKPKTQDLEDTIKNDFKTPSDQYSPHFTEYVMGDPGRFAAMKGYDAIKVTGKQDGAPVVKGEPKAKTGEGKYFSANDQYIVLNRTAIVVEEA